jgi:hypothetical protein
MKTDFERVYPRMTPDEQNMYMYISFSGFYNSRSNTVMMGQDAYDRVMDYRQKMIKKYLPEILKNEKKVVTLRINN